MNRLIDHQTGLCKIRADISALLIIAFVFQLVWPVVVLASPGDQESTFEQDLRASICRVHLEAQSTTEPSVTDEFVCDDCVLCALHLDPNHASLPEGIRFNVLTDLPQVNGAFNLSVPEWSVPSGAQGPRSPPV